MKKAQSDKQKAAAKTEHTEQLQKPSNQPGYPNSQAGSLVDPCEGENPLSLMSEQLNIPVDVVDKAAVKFFEGGAILAAHSDNTLDDQFFAAALNSPVIRRWIIARILSVGSTDPTFGTMNSVTEESLPEQFRVEMKKENLDIGKLGGMLMKWGPIFWQMFGPLIMKKINPTG